MFRDWCERIGEFARLIRFDKRGMGMSDRVPGATTLETRMDDIRAVLDAIGSCAQAIGHNCAPLGIAVRASVHTGEIERAGDGVAGIAVHQGARVAASADPGEVWVSEIVTLLTARARA